MEIYTALMLLKGASFFAALYLTMGWFIKIVSLLSDTAKPQPITQTHTLFVAICWTLFLLCCICPTSY